MTPVDCLVIPAEAGIQDKPNENVREKFSNHSRKNKPGKSTCFNNCFLPADLQTEAAADAGVSVDLDPTVFSSDQGRALEPFEAVPAADAETDSGAVDRRGRALPDTSAATRTFAVINGITLLGFRNRS